LSVLNRSLGAIGSPLKRSPSAHRPSSAARFSMTFISPSDRPGSRFCLGVKPIGSDGWLIIGVDLKKPLRLLHAAYNDEAGITAAFNLNLLARANRELGGTFDLESFQHRAVYNPEAGRIEMYLTSLCAQTVRVAGRPFRRMRGYFSSDRIGRFTSGWCKLDAGLINCRIRPAMPEANVFTIAFGPKLPKGTKVLVKFRATDGKRSYAVFSTR